MLYYSLAKRLLRYGIHANLNNAKTIVKIIANQYKLYSSCATYLLKLNIPHVYEISCMLSCRIQFYNNLPNK